MGLYVLVRCPDCKKDHFVVLPARFQSIRAEDLVGIVNGVGHAEVQATGKLDDKKSEEKG